MLSSSLDQKVNLSENLHGSLPMDTLRILAAERTRSGLKLETPTADARPWLAQSARPRTKASFTKPLVMKPGQWIW